MTQKYFYQNTNCKNFITNVSDNTSFKATKEKQTKKHSFSWMLPLVILFTFLFGHKTIAQTTTDNTSGTRSWTVPAGVTSITVQVWGPGGGGGGSSTSGSGGSGGGGGGYSSKTYAVTTGSTISYTIGAGGAGGAAGNNAGNPGNVATTFTCDGVTITGNRGLGGAGNAGALGTGGAAATGGDINSAGANGTTGGATGGSGGNSGGASGTGGTASTGGAGGTNANGTAGTIPGGGGGGGEYGTLSSRAGGAGANGQVVITYITISSLGAASGCVGGNITINGTNLTGATSVTIGGTAVSSITSNSATQIVAVIGSGTTGTVSVTTPNGTCTFGTTFTVNPSPIITSQPVTPASVCDGSGTRTVSVTATGASSYQWRKNGGNLPEVAPYSNVNSATLTITNPAVFENGAVLDVVIGNGTCNTTSTSAILTVNAVPAASTTPTPANAATGVCFSGTGAVTSLDWADTATATSYDVYFGAGSLPGTVTSNVAVSNYTCGTLSASTTYYWKVVAKNACGDATGSSTWTFTTSALPCGYCTPTGSLTCTSGDYIANVTLNTLNNTTVCNSGGYTAFAATGTQTTSVLKSSNYTLSITSGTYASTHGIGVWIDYNQDGDFADASEFVYSASNAGGGAISSTTITILAGANSGPTKMRVRYAENVTATSTMSCTMTGSFGETEDYTITIVAPAACATPTAQPTSLSLTPASTSISGSFTLASPTADNYLVVINTTGTTPTPTNGTTYAANDPVTGGTVVDFDSNNTFTATGLSSSTLYYVFVFSYNSACTGGPLYFNTSPLNGSTTTLAPVYCTPTGSLNCTSFGDYISNVTINTLNNTTTCGAGGYTAYPTSGSTTTSLLKGSSYTFSLGAGPSTGNHGAAVWLDFNRDGDFTDSGEYFLIGNAIIENSTTNISIPIPSGATAGEIRMRVRYSWATTVVSTMSCTMTGTYGETEDYTVTLVDPAPCVTPTAQPTALNLAPTGTTISGTFTTAVPVADNYLVIINTTGTTPSPVDGTTYSIGGTVGAGNTVIDTDNNNSFTATGLTVSTTYYIFVFSYNSACSGGPSYYTTYPLNGSVTTLPQDYCTPTGSMNCTFDEYISNVTMNTLNNSSTCSAGGYTNYAATGAQTTSVLISSSYNLSLTVGSGTLSNGAGVWIDFNRDGIEAAGEFFLISNSITANSTNTVSITIPGTALPGLTRMRVRYTDTNTTAGASCVTGGTYGETEDYTITLVNPAPCVAPTTQPTALTFGVVTGSTIAGSFTAAVPAPDKYLVVINTTGIAPTLTDGTTYTIGGSVGFGNTVVDTDSNTSFTATGLSASTLYYVFIFSFNSSCTGGPTYYTTNPLTGSTTTLAANYCTATSTSSSDYINNFSTTGGTANITNNGSGFSATGYGNFTGQIVSQQPYASVNFSATTNTSQGFNIWVDWNNDGTFNNTTEKMYSSGVRVTSSTGSFSVPGSASVGNHRMRIRSDWSQTNPAVCNSITYGEAEDYTFTVLALPCSGNPSNIAASAVAATTATLSWTAASPAPASGYQYYVSTSSTDPVPGTTPTGSTAAGVTTANVTGLSALTFYNAWVRSNCGATQGVWVGPVTFTTLPTPAVTTGATVCPGGSGTLSATTACFGSNNLGTTINGSWNAATDPVALQPQIFMNNSPTCDFDDDTSNYTTLDFQVSVTGTYVFSMAVDSGYDGMGYIVQGAFTPGVCGSGTWVVGDDDGGSGGSLEAEMSTTLTAGVTYTLISQIYSSTNTTITDTYQWNITPPTGGYISSGSSYNVEWYTAATGGSPIGTGNNFNPVGVAGSGLADTNTPGTTTYYAVCPGSTAIRTPTDFVINGPTSVVTGSGTVCAGNALITVTLTGAQPWAFTYTDGTTPVNVTGVTTSPYTFSVSPSVATTYTVTALNDVNCTALAGNMTGSATIVAGKTWYGTTDTDWNTASNWSGAAIPTALDCVIIPNVTNDPIISGTNYSALAYSLTVQNGGFLTINPTNTLTVTDFVNVDAGGTFSIENSASLVQINNVANTGNIISKRNALVRDLDYVYWSSPVAGYTVDNITTPDPLTNIYVWDPTLINGNGGEGGYVWASGSTMAVAKGYIARPPSTFTSTAATLNGSFTGVPNNGNISYTISRGTYTGANYYGPNGTEITNLSDNFNLVGNPYPSAISANYFLYNNRAVLQDGVRIWTHGTLPSSATPSPFYNSFAINYTPSDYLTHNLSGTNCCPATDPDYLIGSGQGFFVTMQDGATGTATIDFDNTLRNTTYTNSTFYKNADVPTTNNFTNLERHRIWLDIMGDNQFDRSLVGYIEGATDSKDVLYDATSKVTAGVVSLYSLIEEGKMRIQGKTLPFDADDIIPLGYNAISANSYSIAIGEVDGLFLGNQNIYLEDTELKIIHDLKSKPYVFTTEAGTFDKRFILRYKNGLTDVADLTNVVKVVTSQKVTVYSSNQNIKNIVVYDMLGRKIDSYENVDSKQFTLNHLSKTLSALILQITLDDNIIVTEKVTY